MNGRHSNYSQDFTYCGPNGCSVVDYLLSKPDMFDFVKKFIVCNFNTYSDHAPLHVEFNCLAVDKVSVQAENDKSTVHTKFKWNDNMSDDSKVALEQNLYRLEQCINSNDISIEKGIDDCVSSFVHELNEIMSDFHKCPAANILNKKRKVSFWRCDLSQFSLKVDIWDMKYC